MLVDVTSCFVVTRDVDEFVVVMDLEFAWPVVYYVLVVAGTRTQIAHSRMQKNLEFVAANLLDEGSWSDGFRDVKYVMHVASPFPSETPKDEQDLIRPAVQGTLSVLKARTQG